MEAEADGVVEGLECVSSRESREVRKVRWVLGSLNG
jgi:hypothetical protein